MLIKPPEECKIMNAMKSFGQKPWILPQLVLIIGTCDPVHHGYIALGLRVGNAFADGKKLK